MTIVQWVNLEKDPAYAQDSDVGSVDRCGPLSIKAMFDKDNIPLNYTVRLVPSGSDNVQYTASELAPGRNPNFKMPAEISGLGSTKETVLDAAIRLPAAGGNKYKLEAKDANGTTVTSVEVEAKRKLYYQVLSMNDANGSVPPSSLASMESHAEKHFVKLQKTGAAGTIPYRKTITMGPGGNITQFGSDVGSGYNLDAAFKKVGIAAVFSEYIASMKDHDFAQVMTIGSTSPGMTVTNTDITIVGDRFLWHGLDDTDDAAKRWYVNGAVQYLDSTGNNPSNYIIPRANVEITGSPRFPHGGYHQIKISRDAGINALLNNTSGVLRVLIKVNIVGGWTNGFSWKYSGNDLITCARRTVWTDMKAETKEYTWNHEVGHRFGMVAFGHRNSIAGHQKLPDGPATLYGENRGVNDKGHQGPHCEKGASYTPSAGWSGSPVCVMFGANGIGNNHAPKEYCSECTPIVRKLDLS